MEDIAEEKVIFHNAELETHLKEISSVIDWKQK